ncbi:hypothetical protein LTR96_011117 [Exophiala xenobiotica]|nr:hypothetical protein LTR41_011268 [Exophiala xenobiotica]KAK5215778.1 hypothetical protein LTR72_011192 [Exophiala xenobiotica]KAK5220891.1 hypothetical protein LTR47_011047 [Exophiala xenobiotica]KAK5245534.1 hypothetical protein LTS06_009056 [Exophiala xenobiotica]KAK5263483.1 hypothetical protein LTR96_011117 [Exophiala xenobiotica]
MPTIPKYTYNGPIDCTVTPDRTKMSGKSVIITGGANGMGEVMVKEFVAVGAFVAFADLHPRGADLEKELNANSSSPKATLSSATSETGTTRSSSLRRPRTAVPTTVSTLSLPTLVSVEARETAPGTWMGNWEYTSTKYSLRGFMKTVRRNRWEQSIRINYVAPCWIKSAIRTKDYETWLTEHGIEFGEQIHCAGAMVRIACDKAVSGRSLMITPRSFAAQGFVDVDKEDSRDPSDEYFIKKQATQLRIIEDQWRDDYKVRIYKE